MKYTKQQAQDFLKNKKVYVNGKSEEIQEKLFECGFLWSDADTKVCHTDKPFLFIYKDETFKYGKDMRCFSEHKSKEITAEEILSIELIEGDETKFKTFQEVLVRDDDGEIWIPRHFASYSLEDEYPFKTTDDKFWAYCIQFEGNEGLEYTVKEPNKL